jgi:predicted DCC family thiol-disulfide oxidoreductase YuxK
MFDLTYPLSVYYDGSCAMCVAQMEKFEAENAENKLIFVDTSRTDFERRDHALVDADLDRYVYVLDKDGHRARGVEAFTWMWWALGYTWKARIFSVPIVRTFAKIGYKVISRFRYILVRKHGPKTCQGTCLWKKY